MAVNPGQSLTESPIYVGGQLDAFQVLQEGGGVLQGTTIGGLTYGQGVALDNIIAHAGGGQTNGVQLLNAQGFPVMMARVITVASVGDSVTLPPSLRGYQVTIVNDAAVNSLNVFPAVGEAINALGANAAFALAVGTPTIFYCFTAGLWRTK